MEAIVAFDSQRGISKNGMLPWHISQDLFFFYNKTKYNIVIMGKNTYFSIPEKNRPLKNRLNIILTKEPYKYKEITDKYNNIIFTDNEHIYKDILLFREKYYNMYPRLNPFFKIFFIGGKQIYEKYMPLCSIVWVTKIKQNYNCDLLFHYNFEDDFNEEQIYDDNVCSIFKYISQNVI